MDIGQRYHPWRVTTRGGCVPIMRTQIWWEGGSIGGI
jgi:hypothetical protein